MERQKKILNKEREESPLDKLWNSQLLPYGHKPKGKEIQKDKR